MDGILNIYKEKGYTSHDVVAKLRGILRQKKIGHTGTLDPDAEGVLPVCLGKGTKVCSLLTDKDKTYEAVLLLGKSTDTQDITGTVLEEKTTESLDSEIVRSAVMKFAGTYDQIPPMYSALKVNGKKLYELARQGIEVERKSRTVTIHSIEIKEIDLPRVRMIVKCSKGTYIRTLCHDIGAELGCGGCMETLLRTKVSTFKVSESLTLSQVEKLRDEGRLEQVIMPVKSVFAGLPEIIINKKYQTLAYNGNIFYDKYVREKSTELSNNENAEAGNCIVCDEDGRFIGIFEYHKEKKLYKPVKMFLEGIE